METINPFQKVKVRLNDEGDWINERSQGQAFPKGGSTKGIGDDGNYGEIK